MTVLPPTAPPSPKAINPKLLARIRTEVAHALAVFVPALVVELTTLGTGHLTLKVLVGLAAAAGLATYRQLTGQSDPAQPKHGA